MLDAPPPTYNASSADRRGSDPQEDLQGDPSPPSYTPPTKFTIGKQTTLEPLVGIVQIKSHLALLHAFAELKKRVEGVDLARLPPHVPEQSDRRWTWFVGLAVERYVDSFSPHLYTNLCCCNVQFRCLVREPLTA